MTVPLANTERLLGASLAFNEEIGGSHEAEAREAVRLLLDVAREELTYESYGPSLDPLLAFAASSVGDPHE